MALYQPLNRRRRDHASTFRPKAWNEYQGSPDCTDKLKLKPMLKEIYYAVRRCNNCNKRFWGKRGYHQTTCCPCLGMSGNGDYLTPEQNTIVEERYEAAGVRIINPPYNE